MDNKELKKIKRSIGTYSWWGKTLNWIILLVLILAVGGELFVNGRLLIIPFLFLILHFAMIYFYNRIRNNLWKIKEEEKAKLTMDNRTVFSTLGIFQLLIGFGTLGYFIYVNFFFNYSEANRSLTKEISRELDSNYLLMAFLILIPLIYIICGWIGGKVLKLLERLDSNNSLKTL